MMNQTSQQLRKSIKQLGHRWFCSFQEFRIENREQLKIQCSSSVSEESILQHLSEQNVKTTTSPVSSSLSSSSKETSFWVDTHHTDPALQRAIQKIRESQDIQQVEIDSPMVDVPWFPRKVEDVNNYGQVLLDVQDTVNQDHIQFRDPEYRTRRDEICALGLNTDIMAPIAQVKYTHQENALWKHIYEKVRPFHKTLFSKRFEKQFQFMEQHGISGNEIPQLSKLNEILQATTGFRIKPVSGILSQREFMNAFAHKVFCCTQYIRHHESPDYTPEPDIIHEIIGHIPLFLDPDFAQLSQEIGLATLGASNEDIAKMGAIYWYTFEFGAIKEEGKIKPFSAGIAGSYAECINFTQPHIQYKLLDPFSDSFSTEYPIQDVQSTYFYSEGLQESFDILTRYTQSLKKPVRTYYDHQTQTVLTDKKIKTFINIDEGPLF